MADYIKPLMFENVEILPGSYRNFEGREGQYNRAGDRNFSIKLPEHAVEEMIAQGWNVKRRDPRPEDDGGETLFYLTISVAFGNIPPKIVLITSRGRTTLTEDLVASLDFIEIENADLIVRPYSWSVNGNTGVKAYLKSIYVTQREDEPDLKYADVPEAGEVAHNFADTDGEEF